MGYTREVWYVGAYIGYIGYIESYHESLSVARKGRLQQVGQLRVPEGYVGLFVTYCDEYIRKTREGLVDSHCLLLMWIRDGGL